MNSNVESFIIVGRSTCDKSIYEHIYRVGISELDKEEKSAVVPHKPSWLRMKYVSSDKTYNCISRTCDTIAKNADMMALSQHLFELFRVCPNDRKEIIFIMNNVLFNGK